MRLVLAVWIGKLLTFIGRLMGRKSTSMPGIIALKICPNLIRMLSVKIKKDIIVVCGTNGKTTVNNLIGEAIEYEGYNVICNTKGANMIGGIATVFVQSCKIFKEFTADYACLEVDEAFAVKLFGHLTPTYMVVTNLFRDQLDRYGEIDMTLGLIKKAVNKGKNARLILNGDDPLTVQLGIKKKSSIYFGISEKVLPQDCETRESKFCVRCGGEMGYNYFHYSQLGDFYCSACGYCRPKIDFSAHNINLEKCLSFDINGNRVCLNYRGFYNIYNILAAYSVLSALKISPENFNLILSKYRPQTGRMEEFKFNKPVILNLSKNPAGFNQAIAAVKDDVRKKDIIIVINDNYADGLDVSWIWDVDFDRLSDGSLNMLAVSGTRLYDIALRFKYADINVDYISQDIKKVIINSLNTDSEVCYILVSYTALFSTQKILLKLMKDNDT